MKVNTVNFEDTPILYTNSDSDHIMGNKDKTSDQDATTKNREHSQDWEAARDTAPARTITEAVARETQ